MTYSDFFQITFINTSFKRKITGRVSKKKKKNNATKNNNTIVKGEFRNCQTYIFFFGTKVGKC